MPLVITRVLDGQTFSPDVYLGVEYSPQIQISDHPIEAGAEVSDHAQAMPLRFVVRAVVSETPLGLPSPLAVERAVSFFEGSVGKLLTVSVPRDGVFLSCLLEGYAHQQTTEQGRTFEVQLKQVKIAQSVSVQIPARLPNPVAATGAADAVDAGKQATTSVPTPPAPPVPGDTSTAAGLADFAGSFF